MKWKVAIAILGLAATTSCPEDRYGWDDTIENLVQFCVTAELIMPKCGYGLVPTRFTCSQVPADATQTTSSGQCVRHEWDTPECAEKQKLSCYVNHSGENTGLPCGSDAERTNLWCKPY